jgi:hypothetical protein
MRPSATAPSDSNGVVRAGKTPFSSGLLAKRVLLVQQLIF